MISCCRADQFAVLTTCFTRDSEYFKGCTIQHFPCVGICFLDNQTVQRIVYDTVYHFVIIPTCDFNTVGRCTAAYATSTAATCDIIILQIRVIARVQINTCYRVCRFLVALCRNGFCYDIPARFYIRQFDSAIFIGLECTDCCNCTIVFLMLNLECGVWNTLIGRIVCFLDDQCGVFDVLKHQCFMISCFEFYSLRCVIKNVWFRCRNFCDLISTCFQPRNHDHTVFIGSSCCRLYAGIVYFLDFIHNTWNRFFGHRVDFLDCQFWQFDIVYLHDDFTIARFRNNHSVRACFIREHISRRWIQFFDHISTWFDIAGGKFTVFVSHTFHNWTCGISLLIDSKLSTR